MPRLADFALIAFDMDGVLVHTSEIHSRAFADLWDKLGVAGPEYSAIAGQTTREIVEAATARLGPTPDEVSSWVRFKQESARRYLRTSEIDFADTVPTLDALSQRGFQLALGTGASGISTETVLERLGVRSLFSAVVTAEDVARGKPDPEVYQAILHRTGHDPEATLIVEDSSSGVEAALRARSWVVSVRTGYEKDHPRFLGALADLKTLLDL